MSPDPFPPPQRQMEKGGLAAQDYICTPWQESLVGGIFGKFVMIQFWQEKSMIICY